MAGDNKPNEEGAMQVEIHQVGIREEIVIVKGESSDSPEKVAEAFKRVKQILDKKEAS